MDNSEEEFGCEGEERRYLIHRPFLLPFFFLSLSHSHSCLPFCPLPPSTFSQWDSASFKSFHSLELFHELQLPFLALPLFFSSQVTQASNTCTQAQPPPHSLLEQALGPGSWREGFLSSCGTSCPNYGPPHTHPQLERGTFGGRRTRKRTGMSWEETAGAWAIGH